MYKQVNWPF